MKFKVILIAMLALAFMFFVGNTKVVASIITSCSGQINGQQCFLSDGKSNGTCYNGQCITPDEYAYNVAKEMCVKLSKNNGCYNAEPFKDSDGEYSCTKKTVGSSCSILYSCRGPGCLAGAPATCDADPKCVRQISPDNDKDDRNQCQLAVYLVDGYRYTGGDLPTTCGSALNTKGCDESSCPWDCDDNDPYDSTILLADIEKVEVVIDPDYKKETKEKRKFTPQIPVTPFDNFNIIVTVKKKCGINSTAQMPILPASLVTLDAAGKEVAVASGSLIPIDTTTYQWKLIGWPAGITINDEIMEILIDSIASKRKIFTRIIDPYPWEPDEKPKETPIVMSNCVQTYGKGKHKIVNMRGESLRVSSYFLLSISNILRINGTEKIDPFKKYKEEFSHFSDLKNHKDLSLETYIGRSGHIYFTNEARDTIKSSTSCKDAKSLFFFNDRTHKGYTHKSLGGDLILMNLFEYITTPFSFGAMHELGHAFCSLNDEYLHSKYGVLNRPLTNCVHLPRKDYQYNNIFYGDLNNVGCSYKSLYASPKALLEIPSLFYYKPSSNSLMQGSSSGLRKYNVISCGYCLAAIKGGDPKSYWPECLKLDTEK